MKFDKCVICKELPTVRYMNKTVYMFCKCSMLSDDDLKMMIDEFTPDIYDRRRAMKAWNSWNKRYNKKVKK